MTTAATTTTTGVGKRNNKQVSVQDQKQHGCNLQNDSRCYLHTTTTTTTTTLKSDI